MSDPSKKSNPSRRKKAEATKSNTVSSFISKQDDEPTMKKSKSNLAAAEEEEEVDLDDSGRFFKTTTKPKVKKAKPAPPTSTSNVVSKFINDSAVKKLPAAHSKTTKATKVTKKKSQPDIRKVLSEQERLIHHVVSDQCIRDGLDPEEMQMALAMSESLKDLNREPQPSTSSAVSPKFENPFSSLNKVQSITSVLERYGFKSKKNYTEYEMELLTTNKWAGKRTKFQKFPTALTRATPEKRSKLITARYNAIMKEHEDSNDDACSNDNTSDYKVFSFYLQEMHSNNHASILELNQNEHPTDETLLQYYVTDLFEPSYVSAGYLLKNWREIPGREPTPDPEDEEKDNSCTLSDDLDSLHSRLSQSVMDETLVANEVSIVSHVELEETFLEASDSEMIDLTQDDELNLPIEELDDSLAELEETFLNHSVTSETEDLTHEDEEEAKADVSLAKLKKTFLNHSVTNGIEDLTQEDVAEEMNIDLTLNQSITSETEDLTHEHKEKADADVSITKLEEDFLNHSVTSGGIEDLTQEDVAEEMNIDLTLSSGEECISVPYDDSLHTFKSHLKTKFGKDISTPSASTESSKMPSPAKINNNSHNSHDSDATIVDENYCQNSQNSLTDDDDDVIEISDEEVNYSIAKSFKVNLSQSGDHDSSSSSMEINNHGDQTLHEVMDVPEVEHINHTIQHLLETSNVSKTPKVYDGGLSDSIQEIMRKYGEPSEKENVRRSFRKMQSESQLLTESTKQRKSVQFNIVDEVQETGSDEECFKELSRLNNSLHLSMEDIAGCSEVPQKRLARVQRKQRPKSLGIAMDDDYLVDTDTPVNEPDYKSMTPVELKQELFKYGIRPLPVKKAVQLLEFIFNQLHPEIRVAADEEIDVNDSRRAMNITDIATDIGAQEDDDYVFGQPELIADEECVLPKMRKSKNPSCLIPLHVAFYNMVRSNEKLQKFILEYRPIELDQIHKHFRKFGWSFQLNDIIAFLDKRCITFKTKEQSLSNRHEKKKVKRVGRKNVA